MESVTSDIHATARSWYQLKLSKGEQPFEVSNGQLDGLCYFPVAVDGREYWLTEVGLFDPPTTQDK